jgi:hypothetical protein
MSTNLKITEGAWVKALSNTYGVPALTQGVVSAIYDDRVIVEWDPAAWPCPPFCTPGAPPRPPYTDVVTERLYGHELKSDFLFQHAEHRCLRPLTEDEIGNRPRWYHDDDDNWLLVDGHDHVLYHGRGDAR